MRNSQTIPGREATTAFQINNLLSIANSMLAALLVPNHHLVEPHHEALELDGGCKSAAEMVYIEACNKLTDVLRDKSRWDMDITRALELQSLRINQKTTEILEEKRKAVAWLNTPSYRLKPKLERIQDGMFAVYDGDIAEPEKSLIGIGRTPEAAFLAFDELFAGRIPQSMVEYLIAKEDQINEKQTAVDNAGTQNLADPQTEGGATLPDSRPNWPE